jgi:methylmalonyl-CoA mutase
VRTSVTTHRKGTRIDSGQQTVVGLNKYPPATGEQIDVLKVDNSAVREAQIASLNKFRAQRDPAKVAATLKALTEVTRSGTGNLLELAIDAARTQATVGEISEPLERVYGRYEALVRTVRGVYATEADRGQPGGPGGGTGGTPVCGGRGTGVPPVGVEEVRRLVGEFERTEGRRPRILVAKVGQDGHDCGQKVIATAFADLGFDLDVGPLFQTPAETARQAVENDVHVVGVSTLAAGHLTLVPQLRRELARLGREDILIVAGGVIPPQDYPALYEAGAAAVFGPGTVITDAAARLVRLLSGHLSVGR